MKNSKILALALLTVFTFSSCNNDDPEVVNEEEVITTVTTTLTAGSSVITLTSRDLDGDGKAEKYDGTCKSVNTEDTLYIDLNVLTEGKLKDGKITINSTYIGKVYKT